MSELKKVIGKWSFNAGIECPECKEGLNLFDIEELNEEGGIWMLLSGTVTMKDGKSDIVNWEFECPECKKTVILEQIEFDN